MARGDPSSPPVNLTQLARGNLGVYDNYLQTGYGRMAHRYRGRGKSSSGTKKKKQSGLQKTWGFLKKNRHLLYEGASAYKGQAPTKEGKTVINVPTNPTATGSGGRRLAGAALMAHRRKQMGGRKKRRGPVTVTRTQTFVRHKKR
jgi:hypothetical protein